MTRRCQRTSTIYPHYYNHRRKHRLYRPSWNMESHHTSEAVFFSPLLNIKEGVIELPIFLPNHEANNRRATGLGTTPWDVLSSLNTWAIWSLSLKRSWLSEKFRSWVSQLERTRILGNSHNFPRFDTQSTWWMSEPAFVFSFVFFRVGWFVLVCSAFSWASWGTKSAYSWNKSSLQNVAKTTLG